MQKQELRKLVRNVLKKLDSTEKERQSSQIVSYLLEKSTLFKHSKHIGIYVSQNEQEIDTSSIIRNILINYKTKKSIYVPHVDFTSSTNEMKFYEIKNLEQYENEMTSENRYKLKQFKDNCRNLIEINPSILDLVLVPGLAFTFENSNKVSRLGRGKGYYDRYLSAIPSCYTVGLAFNEQLLPNHFIDFKVPFVETLDCYLNEVLCEKMINQQEKSVNLIYKNLA